MPWFKDVGEAPFVQVTSSVGPITESMIEKRNDISLYISTTKMLMGVDIPGIAIVIFLRPLNMVHYIAQGAGRGGRRLGDNSGMRQRVVAYLLWNNSDIGNNVKGEQRLISFSFSRKLGIVLLTLGLNFPHDWF